jgi:hypothetical protein
MTTTPQPTIRAADRDTLAATAPGEPDPQIDLAERKKLYRWFVRGSFLFAAHVLAVLLVLGYIFSDGMG